MHELDVEGIWNLSLCCKRLADLVLSDGVLAAHVKGYLSPLLRRHPLTDPKRLDLRGRRHLLRVELQFSLGRLSPGSFSEALTRQNDYTLRRLSFNSRFEALVGPYIAHIWDRYTGQQVLAERLEPPCVCEFLQIHWSASSIFLTDSFLIIARASSSGVSAPLPALHLECIDFTKKRQNQDDPDGPDPRTNYHHRLLVYGKGPWEVWPTFDLRRHQLRVCHYPAVSFPQRRGRLELSFQWGKIEHWDASTLLSGGDHPSLKLAKLGALCGRAYNEDDWGFFISEEPEFLGATGARLGITQDYEPLESLPRRRRPLERLDRRVEDLACHIGFFNMRRDNVRIWKEGNRFELSALSDPEQIIPLDRAWFVHIFDFRNSIPLTWPEGAVFHLSGPDQQEIEWKTLHGCHLFCFQDCRGNAWLARRGRPALKQFQHQENLNFSLWEVLVKRPRDP